jgi:hypothetical protein
MDREEEIRLIAYNIWQEEGCIDGQTHEHWLRAELIWESRQKPKASVVKKKTTKKKTTAKTKKVK